jgi:PadR family transcriptional regulator, regulatory protein PadR
LQLKSERNHPPTPRVYFFDKTEQIGDIVAPTNLGELEQLVLLAIARLGDDAYGVTVRREIATRTKRDLAFGSVYTTLARLEEKGLVASHLGEATPERGGRAKKHFVISAEGRRALRRSLSAIRTMARGIDASWETP